MKEIRLIDTGMEGFYGRKEVVIDNYKFTFCMSPSMETTVINKIGSLDNYARAAYELIVNNNYVPIIECNGVFYSTTSFDGNMVNLEFMEFTNKESTDKFIQTINDDSIDCMICEEFVKKIFEVFKIIIESQNKTNNDIHDTTEEPNTNIIETTAVVKDEKPYDAEEQKKAREERMKRIDAKLKDLEDYVNGRTANSPTATVIQLPENIADTNAKNKRKKIKVANNSATSTSVMSPETTTQPTPETCSCGCGGHHNHQHGLTDEEYLARLEEASKYGLVAHAQKPIDGIDYNVAPEFADINAIKTILNSHTCKYKGEEVYWRAVPNYCLRDNEQSINLANELAKQIKAGDLPKLTNNQDFYIQNCPGFNLIDVTSMDPRDNTLIPCLSMIVDYAGVISRGIDANGQSIPLPTIYVGCSMYQADDFMKWANGCKTTRPLILQSVPFTLKNLSTLMSKIDAARCPSK